jgi:bacillithiol synthase
MRSSLLSSYLASGMRKSAFFPSDFGERAARVARVRAAAARPVDERLISALRAQNSALPPSPSREAHLRALGAGGVAAVVTGQQVGLFLGPLYTFYKAASAIAAARLLEAESGVRCVPVFWLQTEDHDFAEIAACTVGQARLGLAVDERRLSVGHRVLGDEIAALLVGLEAAVDGEPHAAEVCALFQDAYRPGRTLGVAFAAALSRFFPELVFLDPRTPELARLALPSIERAVAEAAEIDALLHARGEELRAAGFDEQVHPRSGYTLAFFHAGGLPEGARERLRQNDAPPPGDDPLRYSTSALLRPLVQDALLPTAAYVGGPAEVAYLAQIAPLYLMFGLSPPLVVPRARFRLVPPPVRRLCEELGVQPADAEDPELAARLARPSGEFPNPSWLAELEARLDGISNDARGVARARRSIHHALTRLGERQRRLAAERDAVLVERVRRFAAWLSPGGLPQERALGVAWFAAYAGPSVLAERVLGAVEPLRPDVKDLAL